MRLRIVPIVLLFMVIAIVGISNHSRKKSKLQLIDPISVSSSATMEEKLRSIDRRLLALSKKKRKTVNFIKQLEKTKSNKLKYT